MTVNNSTKNNAVFFCCCFCRFRFTYLKSRNSVEGVQKSPSEDVPKNLVFHVYRCLESYRKISSCTYTESRSSINSHKKRKVMCRLFENQKMLKRLKRLVMCRLFENKFEEDPDFLDDIWFSDETHFWLCGHVNSINCVY